MEIGTAVSKLLGHQKFHICDFIFNIGYQSYPKIRSIYIFHRRNYYESKFGGLQPLKGLGKFLSTKKSLTIAGLGC